MTKQDLVVRLAEVCGLSKAQADVVVNEVVKGVTDALVRGEEVSLPGLGKLAVKERAARTGTNPATREKIEIKASKTVAFKVAKNLKEALN